MSAYTDEQIRAVAEQIADKIAKKDCNGSSYMEGVEIKAKAELGLGYGPLVDFVFYSESFNPLGRFRIESTDLTVQQKAMAVEIIEAGKKRYSEREDVKKKHQEFLQEQVDRAMSESLRRPGM